MKLPTSVRTYVLLGTATFALAACSGMQGFGSRTTSDTSPQITLVERDVESPEVFQTSEAAVWDGRPTLGGVWIASNKTKQPERVIIRNTANGKFVIGALFNRDTSTSGGAMQLSSDAASALDIAAGVGTIVEVTAVRREPTTGGTTLETNQQVAGARIPVVVGGTRVTTTTVQSTPTVQTRSASIAKPFVQVGIFSIEANANNTRTLLKRNGVPSKIIRSEIAGKQFWRVIAGPSGSASESRQLVSMIRKLGFSDAFTVRG